MYIDKNIYIINLLKKITDTRVQNQISAEKNKKK